MLPQRRIADFSHPDSLASCVAREAPDVIVNAAAYTAVDQAEQEEAIALRINGEATRVLAQAARSRGALFIHYSTDYVFAGTGEHAWQPSDPVDPQNAYGRTKLAGEQAIATSGGDWLVFRTSWVYAARGGNFAKTMIFAQQGTPAGMALPRRSLSAGACCRPNHHSRSEAWRRLPRASTRHPRNALSTRGWIAQLSSVDSACSFPPGKGG